MANENRSVGTTKRGKRRTVNQKKDHVPIQVYIPVEHYRTFLRKYKKHGAITRFVREAFERMYNRIKGDDE